MSCHAPFLSNTVGWREVCILSPHAPQLIVIATTMGSATCGHSMNCQSSTFHRVQLTAKSASEAGFGIHCLDATTAPSQWLHTLHSYSRILTLLFDMKKLLDQHHLREEILHCNKINL